jgi:hypothetical protein
MSGMGWKIFVVRLLMLFKKNVLSSAGGPCGGRGVAIMLPAKCQTG